MLQVGVALPVLLLVLSGSARRRREGLLRGWRARTMVWCVVGWLRSCWLSSSWRAVAETGQDRASCGDEGASPESGRSGPGQAGRHRRWSQPLPLLPGIGQPDGGALRRKRREYRQLERG